MNCNVSIHDVSPDNWNNVIQILDHLKSKYNIKKVSLLIIPGLNWDKEKIAVLKKMQSEGIELAAHGWSHKSKPIKNINHFFHSKLISDDCAEHLSLSKADIIKLMNDSYLWFHTNNLKSPSLYVPPAWALGDINKQDLLNLPFSEVEVTSGIFIDNNFFFIPLIGFETKNYFRYVIVKISNFINYLLYKSFGRIRIAIHPNDFELLLKHDIDKYLNKVTTNFYFNELIEE